MKVRACEITDGCTRSAIHQIKDTAARVEYRTEHHGSWSCLNCIPVGYDFGDVLPTRLGPDHLAAFKCLKQYDWDRYNNIFRDAVAENAGFRTEIIRMTGVIERLQYRVDLLEKVERVAPYGLVKHIMKKGTKISSATSMTKRLLRVLYLLSVAPSNCEQLHTRGWHYGPFSRSNIRRTLRLSREWRLTTMVNKRGAHVYSITPRGEWFLAVVNDYQQLIEALTLDDS